MRRSRNGLNSSVILVLAAILGADPARGSVRRVRARPAQVRRSGSRPGRVKATRGRGACPGRPDARERAEMAPYPDRRAARRRHARRLQDRRLCPRQAARMGLEGGNRGAGSPAQLSVTAPSLDDRAADRSRALAGRSAARDRQGFRQQCRLRRFQRLRRLGRGFGQVVYVNYGRPEDFDAMEKMGIDVKGRSSWSATASSSAG